ncbi:DNA polymerase I [Desulfatiglans anilini]|uniref:DNA polymerase I n=1 Tax=Desulfatiglans anilini TaxID=90728 RepID=UPI0004884148|nr:DNA polymerase I [Desulfatiglans anilini]
MPDRLVTVYLVDGSSYLHRAYHAIRNLSNSKGFPTNAVFGFTKMLLKLLAERNPERLAVVFDAKGRNFRHAIYAAYKENRPPMAEDLVVQVPVLKEIVSLLSVQMVEKEGYEADDLIGTYARLLEEKGCSVVIVSGDKDFRQLISPRISLWDPSKDVVTDYEGLKRTYGFEPVRFVDVMGLSGDSTDNIPGVPGIGEKTAVELIRAFGSFDGVFKNLGQIKKKKLRENLEKYREQAYLSRRLVAIERFADTGDAPMDLRIGEPDRERLAQVFRELEFHALWEQFMPRLAEKDVPLRLCLTKSGWQMLKDSVRAAESMVMVVLTSESDPLQSPIAGIALFTPDEGFSYVPLNRKDRGDSPGLSWEEIEKDLAQLLEGEKLGVTGHDLKVTAEVFALKGLKLRRLEFDTMLAAYVVNPGLKRYDLRALAQYYLNLPMTAEEELLGKGRNALSFSEIPLEKASRYSCERLQVILSLKEDLSKRLAEHRNEDLFREIEMRLIPVLVDMELRGVKLDQAVFRNLSKDYAGRMAQIEKEIFTEAGMEFNIQSSQQLGFVLFEKMQLPVQRKTNKTKHYSTDVHVLRRLANGASRIPELVLEYRTLSKLKSTYLDALLKMVNPSTGRIHTSFNQAVTATGRLSSSNPNLQNIPARGDTGREIRRGFIAEEGFRLVSADYSQVELRVFAHYSGDQAFLDAFRSGEDIHRRTASELMGVQPDAVTPDMRRIAKTINFGIIYGMGPRKLSEQLEIDVTTAKHYIERYYSRYSGVVQYREAMISKARRDGFVTTLFNRRRYLPDIDHKNQMIRAEAERMAVNTPIQGTAADLIKMAMIRIHERLEPDRPVCRMLLQVHDELLFEVAAEETERLMPMIRREMEDVYPLKVPLLVDIREGANWDEVH